MAYSSNNSDVKNIVMSIVRYGYTDDNRVFIDTEKLRNIIGQTERSNFIAILKSHLQRFRVSSDCRDVDLVVQAKICPDFSSGCNDVYCQMFHICKFYLLSDMCQAKSCRFGHNMHDGGHNENLLRSLDLELLSDGELRGIFRLTSNRTEWTTPKICFLYNGEGCKSMDNTCKMLHICRFYVYGTCRRGDECDKNHDAQHLQGVLRKYGFDTRRTSQDTLMNLRSLYQMFGKRKNDKSTAADHQIPISQNDTNTRAAPRKASRSVSRQRENKPRNGSAGIQVQQNAIKNGPIKCAGPLMAIPPNAAMVRPIGITDPRLPQTEARKFNFMPIGIPGNPTPDAEENGGVETKQTPQKAARKSRQREHQPKNIPQGKSDEVPNICLFHLRGKCWYKKCKNVHSRMLYQWQYEDNQGKWQDFAEETNIDIEKNYCSSDINDEHYYKTTEGSTRIVKRIDFTNFEKSDPKIRRLSTLSFTSDTSNLDLPFTTKWIWYWKSEDGWIPYGEQDGIGYKASITSTEIEKSYLNDTDVTVEFKTLGHAYLIKFFDMVQVNKNIGTERKLARRPEFVDKTVLKQRKDKVKLMKEAEKLATPSTWEFSGDVSSHFRMTRLLACSAEYTEIRDKFLLDISQSEEKFVVRSIDRIENVELWRAFLEAKAALNRKLKRPIEDIRLYHGTDINIVDAIARQGFDCRLAGTRVGTKFGKGGYFAKTSHFSNRYCNKDDKERKMFVARALLGDSIMGHPSYARPPLKDPSNPSSDLYDSCVDNMVNPMIFVLFNNNQVYPEYIITYRPI
ncbi:hypothetical protein SNE40_011678 [Patella caerulea]|uniref:Poly [ADP-ribose] polymerase 12 n=1 Tax=Patella caerulea TaxID=87958 RepID=A0AAN8PLY7_PATCE